MARLRSLNRQVILCVLSRNGFFLAGKLHITVIDRDAQRKIEPLILRFPPLQNTYSLIILNLSGNGMVQHGCPVKWTDPMSFGTG